jgi:hypothetical protein
MQQYKAHLQQATWGPFDTFGIPVMKVFQMLKGMVAINDSPTAP